MQIMQTKYLTDTWNFGTNNGKQAPYKQRYHSVENEITERERREVKEILQIH